MKLDPECTACDENGMWYNPDAQMDIPCPACNAEPIELGAFETPRVLHPSAYSNGGNSTTSEDETTKTFAVPFNLEELAVLREFYQEKAKEFMKAFLFLEEICREAGQAAQDIMTRFAEAFPDVAKAIDSTNDSEGNSNE